MATSQQPARSTPRPDRREQPHVSLSEGGADSLRRRSPRRCRAPPPALRRRSSGNRSRCECHHLRALRAGRCNRTQTTPDRGAAAEGSESRRRPRRLPRAPKSTSPVISHTSAPSGTSATHDSDRSATSAPPMNRTCSSPFGQLSPSGQVGVPGVRALHRLSPNQRPRPYARGRRPAPGGHRGCTREFPRSRSPASGSPTRRHPCRTCRFRSGALDAIPAALTTEWLR